MPASSSAAAGLSAARPLRNGDPAQELNFRDVVPWAKPVTIARPPRAGWVCECPPEVDGHFAVKNVKRTFPFSPSRHTNRSVLPAVPLRSI